MTRILAERIRCPVSSKDVVFPFIEGNYNVLFPVGNSCPEYLGPCELCNINQDECNAYYEAYNKLKFRRK